MTEPDLSSPNIKTRKQLLNKSMESTSISDDAITNVEPLPVYDPLSIYDLKDDYLIPSELIVEYEKDNPVILIIDYRLKEVYKT